jgi:PPOX class probable F420-dependent enzyme
MAALSQEVKQFLDRPNFVHLSTLMSDGSPHVAPVWAMREGDRILINTSDTSIKGKNTKANPRVALSIVDFQDPYEELQIRGRIVDREPDPDLKTMDKISHKYIGKPFPLREGQSQVTLTIEPEKVRYLKLPFQHTPPK